MIVTVMLVGASVILIRTAVALGVATVGAGDRHDKCRYREDRNGEKNTSHWRFLSVGLPRCEARCRGRARCGREVANCGLTCEAGGTRRPIRGRALAVEALLQAPAER